MSELELRQSDELGRHVAPQPHSVFDDFLARACAHERMGGVVSPFLFKTALWADAFLLFVLLIGLTIDPAGVSKSGFFLVGGGIAGALVSLIHFLAWLLLPLAAAGLAVKLWARNRRTHEAVHVLCAVESVAAVGAGFASFLVLLVFVLELVLWIILIALGIALVFAILAALIAAAGS